ncbi:MAG TPA: protein-methionine-sulfoxide reductase heme-binding subunit MsrQ [Gemmatimonadales bacterium]
MTRATFVTRVVKPLLYVAAVVPAVWVTFALFTGRVEGDQVKYLQHFTGTVVLVTLFLTLAVTPLRRLTGWNEVIRVRRLIGLTAFWYALLHFLSYVVFDQMLSLPDIAEDVGKHPWVLVGFASFLMLVPLAVTSTAGWVRRLGGRRWNRLHRLIYPAAIGGVLHYLWLVKKDVRDPLWFAAALGVLFLARIWAARARRKPARARAPRSEPSPLIPAREDVA